MNIESIISRLEANFSVVSAQRVTDKDFWKSHIINKIYFHFKKSKRYYLMLTGDSLLAAQKLIKVLPECKKLQIEFTNHKQTWDNKAETLRRAHHSLGCGDLEYAITCLFYDKITSRRGLLENRFLSQIILEMDTTNVEKMLENLYPKDNNGWSELRTYNWQFGSYDEPRMLQEYIRENNIF